MRGSFHTSVHDSCRHGGTLNPMKKLQHATRVLQPRSFPKLLREIPDAPKRLHLYGELPPPQTIFLAVVGSREYSPYGKQVCERLISELSGYPVSIVSGLALGIDGIAHEAALKASLHTIAIPGSGLDERVLYPACHRDLARRILDAGGALMSEFEPLFKPRKESFPQRNRIMAGMSHALLVIEATERSGTLITARLAADYNRDVLTVPGPVYSETSKGPHMLLKRGAALIENGEDILEALGIPRTAKRDVSETSLSAHEQELCSLLKEPRSRNELLENLSWSTSELNTRIASLELRGIVIERYGKVTLA